ncbi:Arginine decarboxylase [bacterium HR41]|nr:aminotransferase class V-fold PLP-dependent enzyme [Thermoleophilum sp.]GBD45382.1 Arginine decarboxylase [bacterium HR41]
MPRPVVSTDTASGDTASAAPSAQERAPYLEALRAYAARNPGRLNVPGHKGGYGTDPEAVGVFGRKAFELDIPPGIPGIDAGERPSALDRAQRLAAEVWGAKRTWFLINGASQGNHAALLALAHRGREVIVQRNAHSSTIDALILSGLRPIFVEPEIDDELHIAHCVTPAALERALDAAPRAAGVVVVSPTYYGAVADVGELCRRAHARGVPVVVDEAWGAHLGFHEQLPPSALELGADLVVSSTHKSVGSLTQSAMLHLGRESLLDEDVVDRCVTTVESTSPNALLVGSLDAARRFVATRGRDALAATLATVERARAGVERLPGLSVVRSLDGRASVAALDPLRLMIDVRGTGASGFTISALLRSLCDVHLELCADTIVVAAFGVGEPEDSADRLVAALARAVAELGRDRDRGGQGFTPPPRWSDLVMTPREAFFAPSEIVPFEQAVGRVAAESLAAYPPGIPNVLPGERIERAALDYVRATLERGGAVRGPADRSVRTLRVVAADCA